MRITRKGSSTQKSGGKTVESGSFTRTRPIPARPLPAGWTQGGRFGRIAVRGNHRPAKMAKRS